MMMQPQSDDPPSDLSREERGDSFNAKANDEVLDQKKSSNSSPQPEDNTKDASAMDGDDFVPPTGTNPTPIFLKKTYKMIDSCDPAICSWSPDGLSFIVKDPDTFASDIIPQYFDHNKFSSFARQLNFYGFRKIQTKPIKNSDYDETTAKHVTFFNEKFRKGRQDLLRQITRSTRSTGSSGNASSAKDADNLRTTVAALEHRVVELESKLMETSNEMKGRIDLIMMELSASRHQQQQNMFQHMTGMRPGLLPTAMPSASLPAPGVPTLPSGTLGDAAANTLQNVSQKSFGNQENNPGQWEQPMLGSDLARAFSSASARSGAAGIDMMRALSTAGSRAASGGKRSASGGGVPEEEDDSATLPPHPKQKKVSRPEPQVPAESQTHAPHGGVPGADNTLAIRNSLMLRNAWESDFFNNLMMADGAAAANRAASLSAGLGLSGGLSSQMGYSPYLQSMQGMGGGMLSGMGAGGIPGMQSGSHSAGQMFGANNNSHNEV